MGGPILAGAEDVEEFIEQVDEVQRLIEGLQAGTISPEYIDSKQKQKEDKERERREAVQKRPAGRGPAPPSQPTTTQQQEDADNLDAEAEAEADRRERAMTKVKELMANRERKLHARARYEEYVKTQDKTQFGTDYTKWGIWCPEDEEDDLINSIGPNTPQFRAMEKDIDERHRQMVERRQLAERCRVRGNEAYKARQYSEALRCYQQGIESERTNMTLHANAAMAALKMSCFVQAIEHCDKVLSIAEFLHNNRRDPLCVKALQRRAEAFRALQQHSRAVADLQRALELEPDNTEAAKQLDKARQEDEEARKQRAIAKAVSKGAPAAGSAAANGGGGSASSSAGTAAGEQGPGSSGKAGAGAGAGAGFGGMALDLEKLGRVERLAASLAPVSGEGSGSEAGPGSQAEDETGPVATSSTNSSTAVAAETAESIQQQQGAGVRRGPSLPPRPQSKGAATGDGGAGAGEGPSGGRQGQAGGGAAATPSLTRGGVAETCGQLRELLRDDDACCVYLRECGGLQHIATRIIKHRHGSGIDKTVPAITTTTVAADLGPLLLLLNDACMNDGNLKQLPGLKVLPAAVAALDGAGEEAAAAAATLLCTVVTNEDVRREVSKVLGGGDGMARLIRLLSTAKPAVQGVALALLGNCMVDKPTKAAAGAAWRQDTAAAACFTALLRSPNAILAEKAAVLLGNMATDTGLRGTMLELHQGGILRQLLTLAGGGGSAPSGARTAPGSQAAAEIGGDKDLQRAAATALFNLTTDPAGQRLVAEEAEGLGRLYSLAAPPCGDRVLAARAAGVCARAARVPAAAATLLGLGAVGGMLGTVSTALDRLEAETGKGGIAASNGTNGAAGGVGGNRDADGALLDAAVRTLTVLTSPEDAGVVVGQLVAAGGLEVLLRVIRSAGHTAPGSGSSTPSSASAPSGSKVVSTSVLAGSPVVTESVLANAALCLAAVARVKERLGVFLALDPVPALLGVAYVGRGNTASKNASIALARLAQDPAMLERLRELHGIEIIYQYVKP